MPNVLDARYQNHSSPADLKKVTVRQKYGNHTLAFLDYRFKERARYVLPPEGTPTKVRWGSAPVNLGTHYGYVNHYETLNEGDSVFTRLVSLGTSRRMNAANPSTWSDSTASAIARDFARRYKLRSVVHDHDWVLSDWTSGPQSDWKALKALATQVGYNLWVDGSTLYFLDPKRVLQGASTLHTPVISNSDVKMAKILGGPNIPGTPAQTHRRVLHGLDYVTNEFFTATSGPASVDPEVVTTNVTTYADADQITQGAGRADGDYFTAQFLLKGNARLRPGRVIRVVAPRINGDQEGLWTIVESTHTVTRQDFTTEVVATRSKEPYRNLSRVVTTVRDSNDVPAVVRDGATWEAALQEHVHV